MDLQRTVASMYQQSFIATGSAASVPVAATMQVSTLLQAIRSTDQFSWIFQNTALFESDAFLRSAMTSNRLIAVNDGKIK